jgi:prolyl-tRNA editing enzyme YbaK/EbsC (Cys-tRNA(Pro) deacylase)
MNAIERVRAFLDERNPRLNIIEFDADTSTAPLAAQALGTEVGQIAKSILLKSKESRFVMVVTAGDARIDNKAIKNLMGSRMRMANGEEVFEITGFNIGGVCPFALKQDIPIYLDESLKRYQVVYAAAGTGNTALPITYQELLDITNGCPCNVCQAD